MQRCCRQKFNTRPETCKALHTSSESIHPFSSVARLVYFRFANVEEQVEGSLFHKLFQVAKLIRKLSSLLFRIVYYSVFRLIRQTFPRLVPGTE